MCNLNMYFKRETFDKPKLKSFIMATTSNSYADNSDGEGIYFSKGVLVKDFEKIDITKYKETIQQSKVILAHQRLATSGFTKENLHPFASNEFVLVHNGVINSFIKDKEHSDTHGFFTEFIDTFAKSEGDTRQKKVVYTIKKLLDGASGSWSIALYDKLDEVTYYFKESATSIYCYKNKEFMYITTKEQNTVFFPMIGFSNKNLTTIKLQNYTIYSVAVGDKVTLKKIGSIDEKKYTYTQSSFSDDYSGGWEYQKGYKVWHSGKSNYESYKKDQMDKLDKVEEVKVKSKTTKVTMPYILEIRKVADLDCCDWCKNAVTQFLEEDGYRICPSCIKIEKSCGARINYWAEEIKDGYKSLMKINIDEADKDEMVKA